MNHQALELCKSVLAMAKKAGAAECRAAFSKSRQVEIGYRELKPETVKEASTKNLSIEVYVNSRYSVQRTSDLRKDSLQQFVTSAVETARLLAEDPFRHLPDPKYYQGQWQGNLQVLDPGYQKLSSRDRHDRVRQLEAASLQQAGDFVISVTAMGFDTLSENLVLTSNGFQGWQETSDFANLVMMTVRDQGDRRPETALGVQQRILTALMPIDEIAALVTKQGKRLIGAKKIKTERLPILVENQQVPNLLGGLLEPMTGRAIQQKASFLADRKNQPIASNVLTLIDDPLLPGGQSSSPWDGDGLPARKRAMIEAGVLKDFYVDWYYSRKLGWEPTTGGPSNLIIPPGKRSPEAIMKDIGRGILITGFIGGNSNSTTGDSSVGITGVLFENGAPMQAVAEMNIADNHLSFWKKLKEVANDPWPHGSYRTPSLLFEDVVVAGV
jgi:PmbA protein